MKWIALLCLALVASFSSAQGWKTITSQEAKVRFNVPTQPQTSSRTDRDGQYSVQTRMWVSSGGATNYVVSVSLLPKGFPAKFVQDMNNGIKTGFLNSTNGKVVSDKPATFAGITGRQITFTTPSGVSGALWIVNRTGKIYTFTVAKQKGGYTAERAKFFGSIKLL